MSRLREITKSIYNRSEMEKDLIIFREPKILKLLDNPENGWFKFCEEELVWGWVWSQTGYNRLIDVLNSTQM